MKEREGDDKNDKIEEQVPERLLLLAPLAIEHIHHHGRCCRHAYAGHLSHNLVNFCSSVQIS